jgi:uncharacterized glyoxalase superfamily protein PhnB
VSAVASATFGPELWTERAAAAVDFYAEAFGARELAAVGEEHGWRLGRIMDPFGHESEVGRPLGQP